MTIRNTMRTGCGTFAVLALFLFTSLALPQPVHAAGEVTDANVAEKVESAATKADHEALAAYFRGKATEAGETVQLHEKMLAATKRWESGKEQSRQIGHCGLLVRSAQEAEAAYKDLAKEHSQLAQAAK